MSNKQEFIEYVKNVMIDSEMPENAKKYFETLMIEKPAKEKPLFTDNGKLILQYMKDNYQDNANFSSKQIAEGIMLTSRAVSGAIRKLVTDGFVNKVSADPVIYQLSDKGIEIKIV